MPGKDQGFTLIELMIVVAIIGILAAIAIPAYSDYTIRSQVAEGISLTSSAKVAASEYFQNNGAFATSNAAVGLPAAGAIAGEFVTQVQINAGGAIQITYGNGAHAAINGAALSLTPATATGSVQWACSAGATLAPKYIPSSCR